MSAPTIVEKAAPRPLPLPKTSVGSKVLVALTGLALFGFVAGHMMGNLQIFLGREVLNDYAQFLQSKPELLWGARLGLLAMIVIHIVLTIKLRKSTFEARPSRYVVERTIETTIPAKLMLLSGLVVLVFIIYHLAHFTVGVTQTVEQVNPATGQVEQVGLKDLHDPDYPGPETRHDVYAMVILGFQNPFISGLYIIGNILLGMHLAHGVSSMFQTLGLNNGKNKRFLRRVGPVVAAIIVLGNLSIPVAVLTGMVTLSSGG